jgi:hypothetical protein
VGLSHSGPEKQAMRSKSFNAKPLVETLEGRRLFSAGDAPMIGPVEAHEYAASQAAVTKEPTVRAAEDEAKKPEPRPTMFWVRQESLEMPRTGGWLRAGSLLD